MFFGCGTEHSGPGAGPDCTLTWVSYRSGPPNVWAIELPEGAPRQLTHFDEGCGRWGIDESGGYLYFGGKLNARWDVFRIPLAGGDATRVVGGDKQDTNPAISPDGERVCFLTKRWYFSSYDRELALTGSSGGEVIRLTDREGADDSAVWSPGGDRIAFVRSGWLGRFSVATLDPDNPASVSVWTSDAEDAYEPRWAPDGSAIICVMSSGGIRDIWRIEIPSGEKVNLTNSGNADENPAISPCGEYVAHQVYRSGQWDIAVTPTAGGETVFLTDDPAEDISPCWSPCGSWIFWVSYRDGDREIYGAPACGTEPPVRITDCPGDDIRPLAWEKI